MTSLGHGLQARFSAVYGNSLMSGLLAMTNCWTTKLPVCGLSLADETRDTNDSPTSGAYEGSYRSVERTPLLQGRTWNDVTMD